MQGKGHSLEGIEQLAALQGWRRRPHQPHLGSSWGLWDCLVRRSGSIACRWCDGSRLTADCSGRSSRRRCRHAICTGCWPSSL